LTHELKYKLYGPEKGKDLNETSQLLENPTHPSDKKDGDNC